MRTLLHSVLALALCSPLWGQATNISVSGTTSRQAVITYTAPDSGRCTIQAAEDDGTGSNLTPLAFDVDTAQFAASNSDNRFSNLDSGNVRTFVLGTVPVPESFYPNLNSSGAYVSRVLHANTKYNFKVTCSGSASAMGHFTTSPVYPGNTRELAFAPIAGAGVYAVPTPYQSDWSNGNWSTYDVMSGLKLRAITLPGSFQVSASNKTVTTQGTSTDAPASDCSGWTYTGGATSIVQGVFAVDGNFAEYSGTSQQKCALLVNISSPTSSAGVDALRFRFRAKSSTTDGVNNILQACPTVDGKFCAPGSLTRTITLTTSVTEYCLPSCGAIPAVDTGTIPPLSNNTTGGGAQVWGNANFGVIFWKTGSGAGTVDVDQILIDTYGSYDPTNYAGGMVWPCGSLPINDSTGHPGYLCKELTKGGTASLLWIHATTGESRWLGRVWFSSCANPICTSGTAWTPNTKSNIGGTDLTQDYQAANVIYIQDTEGSSTGPTHIVKLTLPASGSTFYDQSQPIAGVNGVANGTQSYLPVCPVGQDPSTNPCAKWTDMTPKTVDTPNGLRSEQEAWSASIGDPTPDFTILSATQIDNLGNQYLFLRSYSETQDSLAWVWAFDTTKPYGSNSQITGGFPIGFGPASAIRGPGSNVLGYGSRFRWCGYHTCHQHRGVNLASFTFHNMQTAGKKGAGPYTVTLTDNLFTATCGAGHGTCTGGFSSITPTAPAAPTTLYDIAVGDAVVLPYTAGGETQEYAVVEAISTSNVGSCVIGYNGTAACVTLRRQTNNFIWNQPSGGTVKMACGMFGDSGELTAAPEVWWDFVNDPHGDDVSNTTLAMHTNDYMYGHYSWSPNPDGTGIGISESRSYSVCGPGYAANSKCADDPSLRSNGIPWGAGQIANDVPFAGVIAYTAQGASGQKHPAAPIQVNAPAGRERQIAVDSVFWDASTGANPTHWTQVGGPLWKAVWDSKVSPYNPIEPVHIKHHAQFAIAGSLPLADISGPASSITTGSVDNYKYCYAYKAGECYAGSAVGEAYVNAPNFTAASYSCTNTIGVNNTTNFCFADANPNLSKILEIGIFGGNSTDGSRIRQVSMGQYPVKWYSGGTAQFLPNGKWIRFNSAYKNRGQDYLLEHQPWVDAPYPRNTYKVTSETLTPPANTATAVIEFGYDPTNFYCTSRQETCVSAGTYSDGTPFYFKTADTYSRAACTNSCTIDVPLVPGAVGFWRAHYYKGDGSDNGTSAVGVIATDTVLSASDVSTILKGVTMKGVTVQ